MIDGDGLVQVSEINSLLHLPPNRALTLMHKGVFSAVKLPTGIWAVAEQDVAVVCDRIIRYRTKQPFHPDRNMTIEEAMDWLGVSKVTIYALLARGDLDRAENEVRTMVTRESVEDRARRLGRPRRTA